MGRVSAATEVFGSHIDSGMAECSVMGVPGPCTIMVCAITRNSSNTPHVRSLTDTIVDAVQEIYSCRAGPLYHWADVACGISRDQAGREDRAIGPVLDFRELWRPALNDNYMSDGFKSDKDLDQFYTRRPLAAYLYTVFCRFIDPTHFLLLEPGAGKGAFLSVMPEDSLGFDPDPRYPGVLSADFLALPLAARVPQDTRVAVLGNPPFGRNASLAVRFFKHAACRADVIAFIVPLSFRKATIQNRLDRRFRLIHEETLPRDAFVFRDQPYNVPAAFQIWQRQDEPRETIERETSHPDFEFATTPLGANFAIQRVGTGAGRIHRDFTKSMSSHYFIKGPVLRIMRQLDFSKVTKNVAGNPSLAKAEIVALYKDFLARKLGSSDNGPASRRRRVKTANRYKTGKYNNRKLC